MAEGQGTTPTATLDKKGGAPIADKSSTSSTSKDTSSWLNKPENYGNTAGDKIESTLSPVSNTVGKGLETVTKPVGGLVDGVLGGVMRSGEAFGETVGVGYGNKKKKKEGEDTVGTEAGKQESLVGEAGEAVGGKTAQVKDSVGEQSG